MLPLLNPLARGPPKKTPLFGGWGKGDSNRQGERRGAEGMRVGILSLNCGVQVCFFSWAVSIPPVYPMSFKQVTNSRVTIWG